MKNQMAMTSFVDSQFYNKVLTLKIKIMNDLVVLRQGFEDSLNLLAVQKTEKSSRGINLLIVHFIKSIWRIYFLIM